MSEFGPSGLLSVGEVIRGTYTVEALLGRGAFADVYRVQHRFLGTQAMKVFRPVSGAPKAEAVLQEARILSSLLDPHVVRVFEANTLSDSSTARPYITMEFVAGGTLEEFLERRVRLHPVSAMKTARQICSGLTVAHGASPPIVHRDIKPQNVLVYAVSPHGTSQVKVGDFGLAQHVDPESLMACSAGTITYLAPEAVWGFHTPASDVYSVGVVMFRMLTGIFPFPLPDDADLALIAGARDTVLRSRKAVPTAPSNYCMGLPSQIDGIVRKALEPEASNRYRDAVELGLALDRLIQEFS